MHKDGKQLAVDIKKKIVNSSQALVELIKTENGLDLEYEAALAEEQELIKNKHVKQPPRQQPQPQAQPQPQPQPQPQAQPQPQVQVQPQAPPPEQNPEYQSQQYPYLYQNASNDGT